MDLFGKLYARSLRYLSYRPRSVREVKTFLQKAAKSKSLAHEHIDDAIIESILARLQEQKFIDDNEFAKWFIDQRNRVKPTGERLLKMELKQKGIDAEIIDEQLTKNKIQAASGEPRFGRETNEVSPLGALIQRRIGRYKGLQEKEIYQKLGQFLMRRGFSYGEIKPELTKFLKKEYNTEEE